MTVTEIRKLSSDRLKIITDDGPELILYKSELRKYHIEEGHEIDEADYRVIMEEVLPKRARARCLNLLKNRDYTTEQLRRKLKEGGYPPGITEDAIDYVASFHYIDDMRYAVDYIRSYADQRSRQRICEDLLRRGLSSSMISEAFEKWEEDGGHQDEQAMIESILAKKGFNAEESDERGRQKMYVYLSGKGFSAQGIRKALKISTYA